MNKFSKHKLNNLKYKFKPWRKKTKNYYKIMNKNTVFGVSGYKYIFLFYVKTPAIYFLLKIVT